MRSCLTGGTYSNRGAGGKRFRAGRGRRHQLPGRGALRPWPGFGNRGLHAGHEISGLAVASSAATFRAGWLVGLGDPGRRSVLAHGHQSLCPGLSSFELSALPGRGQSIVSCFYTNALLVSPCCQRPGCVPPHAGTGGLAGATPPRAPTPAARRAGWQTSRTEPNQGSFRRLNERPGSDRAHHGGFRRVAKLDSTAVVARLRAVRPSAMARRCGKSVADWRPGCPKRSRWRCWP